MKHILLLAALVLGLGAFAQQEPQYSLFKFNKQVINPAFAGANDVLSGTLDYRKQWVDIDRSPQTVSFGIHSPIGTSTFVPKNALGLTVVQDELGVTKTLSVFGQYAYRIYAGETTISIGIQAGFDRFDDDLMSLQAADPDDKVIKNSMDPAVLFNAGVGIFAYSDKFFAGFSVPRIIAQESDDNNAPTLVPHYYGMAGAYINITEDIAFSPAVQVKSAGNTNFQSNTSFDITGGFIFFDRFEAGMLYRFNEALGAYARVQLGNNLQLGYAYDLPNGNNFNGLSQGSHEILLGFDLRQNLDALNSPRFVKFF